MAGVPEVPEGAVRDRSVPLTEDTCVFCVKTSFNEPLQLIRIDGQTYGVCRECYQTKLRGTHVTVNSPQPLGCRVFWRRSGQFCGQSRNAPIHTIHHAPFFHPYQEKPDL
jgi:hypothetical protein